MPHEWWKIHVPYRGWNSKTLWRRSGSENIHLHPGSPKPRRKTRKSSRRIGRVFFSPISRLIVVWWWSKKWFLFHFRQLYLPSSRWTQSQTVRSERVVIPYSTQVHRRDQGYKYISGCNAGEISTIIGTLMEIGELSDTWTLFTRFTILDEKPPDGCTWSRRRLTRKQTTSRPDSLWPEIWKDTSEASKRREKQKWAVEKPKLDNATKLRSIHFIGPAGEEFKEIYEKKKKKRVDWKFRCQLQCLAKPDAKSTGKPVALRKIVRRNTPSLLKPTNPRESVWKELFIKVMKIILQGKEFLHWAITILCTNVFLCIKQWKYQMQKQQWTKNGKAWKDTGMAADESQKQKWGDRWSKEWGQNSTFCVVKGHLSSS